MRHNPEGPDGWIKDECSRCGAMSGDKCLTTSGKVRSQPHVPREQRWSARRVRELREEAKNRV